MPFAAVAAPALADPIVLEPTDLHDHARFHDHACLHDHARFHDHARLHDHTHHHTWDPDCDDDWFRGRDRHDDWDQGRPGSHNGFRPPTGSGF